MLSWMFRDSFMAKVETRVHRCLALSLLLVGCHSGPPSDDAVPAPTGPSATLQVENQGFLDMTVYVLEGASRQRLGVARGHATTQLAIPEHLVRGGSGTLRFYCDPIGGGGLPVSEEIVVAPGDTVELTIPPS
jgi:hypothetical protein